MQISVDIQWDHRDKVLGDDPNQGRSQKKNKDWGIIHGWIPA